LEATEKLKLGTKKRFDEARSLLSSYQSAWSSGDSIRVAELYSNDAVRTDTLFHEKQEGQEAITSFAESFFAWYPDALWILLQSFGEWQGESPIIGGTFAVEVTDSANQTCEVLVAVLLQASEGKIAHESIYYEPDSLIKCGWAK
jgi:ketosteroid isomerase-like protein